MVDYGKTISTALKFAIEPKRWLPVFAVDVVTFLFAVSYMIPNLFLLKDVVGADVQGLMMASQIIGVVASMAMIFIVWMLIRLYVTGALLHQSVRPKEYDQSWKVSWQRYFSLLAVSVIVALLSGIGGMVPYGGFIISFIIGLIFFFAMPAVIADNMSFDKALRASYVLFREKASDVFLSWLLIGIISSLIMIAFIIPVSVIAITTLLPSLMGMAGGGVTSAAEILSILMVNGWSLVPAGIVMLIGFSITMVFSINAMTNFYQQIKIKKSII